jgi:cytochrome c oxidase assembly protein subunit 15
MDQNQNGVSWLHRFAAFVACMTFGLIVAGALVTSNDAGLSVPDWPTAFGKFQIPRLVGGVKFEFTHRMIAGTVALLTIALALWLWRSRSARYIKILGGIAVLAVIAQAVLGGIGVLFYLPKLVSIGHATLAQTFFALTVSLALFTRTDWRWDEIKVPDITSPSLRGMAAFTSAVIFIQVIMGAAFRHNEFGIAPHFIGGIVVTISVLWLFETVFNKYSEVKALKIPAVLLIEVVVLQFFLGIVAYAMKLDAAGAPQPLPGVVIITTTHVAVGALVVASGLFMTFQVFKYVAPRRAEEALSADARKAPA